MILTLPERPIRNSGGLVYYCLFLSDRRFVVEATLVIAFVRPHRQPKFHFGIPLCLELNQFEFINQHGVFRDVTVDSAFDVRQIRRNLDCSSSTNLHSDQSILNANAIITGTNANFEWLLFR